MREMRGMRKKESCSLFEDGRVLITDEFKIAHLLDQPTPTTSSLVTRHFLNTVHFKIIGKARH
jgi:hypothetical protein